jgi:hypothetical protein
MTTMPFVDAAVRTAALWEDNWDEEDQVDQRKQKPGKIKRSVSPQVVPQAVPLSETFDCWEEVDEDTLVDILQPKPPPAPVPAPAPAPPAPAPEQPAAAEQDFELTAAKKVVAPKQRYWGKVKWIRNKIGWVTSDDVRTDRIVKFLHKGRHSADEIEIRNAIYLHKDECNFVPCFGMHVSFRVEPDAEGGMKCVAVREESWTSFKMGVPQDQRVTLKEYKEQPKKSMQRISDSKSDKTSTQDALKPHKDSKAKLSSPAPKDDAPKGDTQRWFEARMSKPDSNLTQRKNVQAKLNSHNLKKHSDSCSSSTAPGSSCNTSVASELDVQSQASARLKRTLMDRPRDMHSSIAVSIARVELRESKYVEIEEPTEEAPSDQPPVAEHWEDEVSEEDVDEVDAKVTTGYIKRSGQTVDVEIKELTEDAASDQPQVAESWDKPPVAVPAAKSWEADEVPECWCPKRPRQKMLNKKNGKTQDGTTRKAACSVL